MSETDPLLTVRDLVVDYGRPEKPAVSKVSLHIARGETLGLVGESGSGKSTIARAVLGLTPYHGSIVFDGRDLGELSSAQFRRVRANLQMIFQDPYSTLDPRMPIGRQVAEPFVVHKVRPPEGREKRVADLLTQVGLEPDMARRFPHEFSGGQRQRIAIARATALSPSLIVCDEPTSALDVSVQAHVLSLLEDLQRSHGMAYLFIAHNLGVVKRMSSRVAVMHMGQIIETGPTDEVFHEPQHDYTRALLAAVLQPDPALRHAAGTVPADLTSPIDLAEEPS